MRSGAAPTGVGATFQRREFMSTPRDVDNVTCMPTSKDRDGEGDGEAFISTSWIGARGARGRGTVKSDLCQNGYG